MQLLSAKVYPVVGAVLVASHSPADTHGFLQLVNSSAGGDHGLLQASKGKHLGYGSSKCPCVGIDGLEGETMVQLKWPLIGESYPADLGAHCEKWDNGRHPKCKDEDEKGFAKGGPGKNKGWCAEPWCYVDPCNCHLDIAPKEANYLPKGRFQSKEVYFSYNTCGGVDTFTSKEDQKQDLALVKKMCEKPVDEDKWGLKSCSCIGIDGQPGHTVQTIEGKEYNYPASVGAVCDAWDKGLHPDCVGDAPPAWCQKKWCYIDPCSCDQDSWRAKELLPGASYQGKPLFYSYAACGNRVYDQEGITKSKDLEGICHENDKAEKSHGESDGKSGGLRADPIFALAVLASFAQVIRN